MNTVPSKQQLVTLAVLLDNDISKDPDMALSKLLPSFFLFPPAPLPLSFSVGEGSGEREKFSFSSATAFILVDGKVPVGQSIERP